jgi:hypothetical protein
MSSRIDVARLYEAEQRLRLVRDMLRDVHGMVAMHPSLSNVTLTLLADATELVFALNDERFEG